MILAERAARIEAEALAARAAAVSSGTEALIARLRLEIEKLKVDQYNAETKRLQVMQAQAMTPEQVAAIAMQTVRELITPNGITPTQQAPAVPAGMPGQQAAPMPN